MFPDIWPGYQGMSEPYLPVPPQSVSGLDLSLSHHLVALCYAEILLFWRRPAGDIKKHRGDRPPAENPVVLGSAAKLTEATDLWIVSSLPLVPEGITDQQDFRSCQCVSCWVYLLSIYLCKNDLVQSLRIHIFPFEKWKYPLIQIWLFSNPDTRHILWMSKAPYDAMFAYVSLHRCSQWESPGGVKCLIQDTFPDFFNMLRLGTRWSRAFSLGFVCGFRRYPVLLYYSAVDLFVCCTGWACILPSAVVLLDSSSNSPRLLQTSARWMLYLYR